MRAITRGTFFAQRGSRAGLQGRVVAGGADYQLWTDDDITISARYLLQTSDGELIKVRNCGSAAGLIPDFEARSDGPYAWLNQGDFTSDFPIPNLDLDQVTIVIHELAKP